jgi:hypothetical protein
MMMNLSHKANQALFLDYLQFEGRGYLGQDAVGIIELPKQRG